LTRTAAFSARAITVGTGLMTRMTGGSPGCRANCPITRLPVAPAAQRRESKNRDDRHRCQAGRLGRRRPRRGDLADMHHPRAHNDLLQVREKLQLGGCFALFSESKSLWRLSESSSPGPGVMTSCKHPSMYIIHPLLGTCSDPYFKYFKLRESGESVSNSSC
jgi:hypothetical protein